MNSYIQKIEHKNTYVSRRVTAGAYKKEYKDLHNVRECENSSFKAILRYIREDKLEISTYNKLYSKMPNGHNYIDILRGFSITTVNYEVRKDGSILC